VKYNFGRFLLGGSLALVASVAFAQIPLVDAEVRKVDKDNQKITLKHGEIKNLDMPAMTMVFNVKDPSVLDKLNAGDKVQFRAANEGGKFVVTEIQPAK
jgi:Cu/Ag efflux protein CusF